ncbi:Uncharacterised protein [Hafnia alvei]|uniref:Uncharacterized protein n=1 Tax=Hafnia alvei TaxID=569 RepID=A0A377PKJ4_HAFAL|nr:Uncharacterised protein [Hafnia alvei]
MSHDQATFLAVFFVKVALGLIVFTLKPWLGVLFLVAYALYVWREIRNSDTAPEEEMIEPLKIRPSAIEPPMGWIVLQIVLSLIVIATASHIFYQPA